MASENLLIDGDDSAPLTVILGHGAGLSMDSPFMQIVAEGIAARGLRVVRFEFPYMAKRRLDGKKRGPDPTGRLLESFSAVIAGFGAARLVIGGKSLGGRMASLLADEAGVRGLVCLGYPFHPPGKPEKTRTAHLERLQTPTLILQGERDPFGNRADIDSYRLSESIRVQWLPDGDHSFVPRKKSGVTEAENLDTAVAAITRFASALEAKP